MFTGIVQGLVPVVELQQQTDLTRLALDMGSLAAHIQLGASVAVNGTCLTVTRVVDNVVHFDVIVETLNTTNLGALTADSRVNVERSFKVGDEIGGHIVSGHVTGTCELLAKQVDGHNHVLRFRLAPEWGRYLFHKGFVALDGASLTISSLDRNAGWFEVSLIPETLARTTLGSIQTGNRVNIEVDAQSVSTVDTVERVLADPVWRERYAG